MTPLNTTSRRRRRSDAGFTMMEVLVAALVLGIGLVGIIGMQSTAAVANRRAYDMRTGMDLAETSLERLKRDAIGWTGNISLLPANSWLGYGIDDTRRDGWVLPPSPTGASNNPTYNDLALPLVQNTQLPVAQAFLGEKNSRYCVQYRLTWVIPDNLARADVRVLWPMGRAGERALAGECDNLASGDIAETAYPTLFEWVRVTGMVRQNTVGIQTGPVDE